MSDIATIRFERCPGAPTERDGPSGPIYTFVISSWLHSYRQSYMRHVEQDPDVEPIAIEREYWRAHHSAVERLLATTPLVLAHYGPDPDSYVGWACGEPGRLHWAYVKGRGPWRRCGTGARLVEEAAGTAGAYSLRPLVDAVAEAFERKGWIYTPIDIGTQPRNDDRRDDRQEQGQARADQAPGHAGPIRKLQREDPNPPGHDAEYARDRRERPRNPDSDRSVGLPDVDR